VRQIAKTQAARNPAGTKEWFLSGSASLISAVKVWRHT
jgi:hypothetical protein